MKVVESKWEIIVPDTYNNCGFDPVSSYLADQCRIIEQAARTCYQSSNRISGLDSTKTFLRKLVNSGHHAMLEFGRLHVKFITDRSTANQIVRHRLASFAQESLRYNDISKDAYGGLQVVKPASISVDSLQYSEWEKSCLESEQKYHSLRSLGEPAEVCRAVLPLCTKTEIHVATNFREWRHIFGLRLSKHAQLDIRLLFRSLYSSLVKKLPEVFDLGLDSD